MDKSGNEMFYIDECGNKTDEGLYEDDSDFEYPLELRKQLKVVAMGCGLTSEQAEMIYHCDENSSGRSDLPDVDNIVARYVRTFSDSQLEAMLSLNLPHLIERIKCLHPENKYAFDIHLREKSELMVYHGGTRLLTIGLSKIERGNISFKSDSYSKRPGCDAEFTTLKAVTRLDDIDHVANLVCAFLSKVVTGDKIINDKYFKNGKEGYWSSRMNIDYGRNWQPGMEWIIIDREAVLGFDDEPSKSRFYKMLKRTVQSVKNSLQLNDEKTWGKLTASDVNQGESDFCDFGDELDFLAIGPNKQLVCIELKHGSYTSGIYWGPLQASVYRDAYLKQLGNISESIKKMVKQRVALGLLTPNALEWLPENSFNEVEGILAIADVGSNIKSTCWKKAITVNSELNKLHKPVKMVRSEDGLTWKESCEWS